MEIRKKITVSTLAVSLAAAAFSGLPLSGKGVANYFGSLSVSAAANSNLDFVKQKLDRVYAELQPSDRTKLKALRSEIDSKITKEVFDSSFAPILAKAESAGVSANTLYSLFKAASTLSYDPSYQNLVNIRNNPDYIDAAKKIGQAGGVDNLTVDDLAEFVFGSNGIEKKLVDLVRNKTLAQLNSLLNDSDARNALVREAFHSALSSPVGDKNLGVVLSNLGISEDQIATAVTSVQNKLNSGVVKDAAVVLVLAYLSAEGIDLPTPPVDPGDGGNPGGGGNTGGGGSAGGGGAAGGGSSSGGGAAQGGSSISSGSLESLLAVDVSKSVKIVDGKATLELNEADLLKSIAAIQAAAKEQQEMTLSLNLGTVNASSIDVPVSKAIVVAAKTAGIANLAITVNGLTITLPLVQFGDSLQLFIHKNADTVLTNISKLPLASDVYDFGLEVGGKAVTSFRNPITIRIPLRNVNVDKELLSVAKIVNGSLEFQGGIVDGQFIVEPRDTFSSYAVVENKVNFTDISSVQSWAGRQIQVVAAKGAIEGKAAGVFAPKDAVTRAEFAKMLIRALNLENGSAVQSFSDVKSTDWFAPYVAAAVEQGIIQGRSADKFAPSDLISRAEMATMISRALKVSQKINQSINTDQVLTQFSDASDINSALKEGVAFAASNNLVIGNNGKFNPNLKANRAEAAVMIYRTMNYSKK